MPGAEPSGREPVDAPSVDRGVVELPAVEAGLRALRHRDLSAADLDRRLRRDGFDEAERAEALARLERSAVLDDRRYAESRARSLAARAAGDVLIRHELERSGVAPEVVDEAVEALEPEAERARRVLERRGQGPRTARYLHAKGFREETVSALVANERQDELG